MIAAYAKFPGLKIRKADLILGHGVTPSTCHITAAPQDYISPVGNLEFGDANGPSFTLYDCAVESIPATAVSSWRGQRIQAIVKDRRWRWEFKQANGRYNLPLEDGSIEPDTEKSYEELIQELLEILGEKTYEIVLPEGDLTPPHIEWEDAGAATELGWITDRIGCTVSLGLDNIIHVTPVGYGPEYPPNGRERMPIVYTKISTVPYGTAVKYAPTIYDMQLQLEAVGLDRADGRSSDVDMELMVVPIDDLSYNPGDWSDQIPGWYTDITDWRDRKLANRSVYKWYRIKALDDGTLVLPDGLNLNSIFDILPLRGSLIRHEEDTTEKGVANFMRPRIQGQFYKSDLTGLNSGTVSTPGEAEWCQYDGEFHLDTERGIVMFPEHMIMVDELGHQDPANLYLSCSFHVRDAVEHSRECYIYFKETGLTDDIDAGTTQLEQLDIHRKIVQKYDEFERTSHTDNKSDLDAAGEALADAALLHYSWDNEADMEWDGLIPYTPLGNISQMRWIVGDGPARTYGSTNKHAGVWMQSRSERRIREERDRKDGTVVRMKGDL